MTTTTRSENQRKRLPSFFRDYYRVEGRQFPWREAETTPFQVLLAEMLLRQTRADQVVPVWTELTNTYPDAASLAGSNSDSLLELVRPLGLGQQRTVALQAMSASLVERFRGRVPRNEHHLAGLPHVGVYCANAVRCFSFKQRVPIIDSNVLRLFSRLTGFDFGRDNRRSPEIDELAWLILPKRGFVEHNYGLLDFSAMVCRPRGPVQSTCALKEICSTGLQSQVD